MAFDGFQNFLVVYTWADVLPIWSMFALGGRGPSTSLAELPPPVEQTPLDSGLLADAGMKFLTLCGRGVLARRSTG